MYFAKIGAHRDPEWGLDLFKKGNLVYFIVQASKES